MNSRQDTAASVSSTAAPRKPRAVFLLEQGRSFPPTATAAERICQTWLPYAVCTAPALVYAQPEIAAALVDHLRPRVLQAAAVAVESATRASLAQLTQAAIDEGSTLIAGGVATEDGWQPSLLVNVARHSVLCAPDAPAGPLLAVLPGPVPSSSNELTHIIGPHLVHRLDDDLHPSPQSQSEGAS